MDKFKIIGTGLTGLLGSRIIELLNREFNFIDISLHGNKNILDVLTLEKTFKENNDSLIVLHTAAFVDADKAWMERGNKNGLCYLTNVEGTRNIVRLCKKYDKYLIFTSTNYVFNGKKEGLYTEKDYPDPVDWYGKTKFLAETIILKEKIPASILRLSFLFRSKYSKKIDLVRKIINGLKNRDLNPMFSDQVITPSFVDDVVFGIKYFIKNKPTGIYNLCPSDYYSPYDLALLVAETFGYDKNLVRKTTIDKYLKFKQNSRPWPKNLAFDNQKITKLGIKMRNIKDSLTEMKKQLNYI